MGVIEALELIPRLLTFMLDGIDICVSAEHEEKALGPIDVTEDGIDIWVNDEHELKAYCPIDVTEDGIDICVSAEHEPKAYCPICWSEEGSSNVTFLSEEHALKV